ncbi:TRAP transporter small permease subunit [Chloroflexota bacterium]
MRIIRNILYGLDLSSYWTGRIFSWLAIAIIVNIFYEVIARYFFDAPTLWGYDMAYYLGGSFITLGACYVTLVKRHVRIDVFYMRFPRKIQLWIDTIFTVVFFSPLWVALTYISWKRFAIAVKSGELSIVGFWYPPLWPIRLTVALGMTLFVIAGISWLIKTIYELRTGSEIQTGLEAPPR